MSAEEFIERYGLGPDSVDPKKITDKMMLQCLQGLNSSEATVPMIPTYLRIDGIVPVNEPVIVIDAGGTNFRSALVKFTDNGAEISDLSVRKMPGIDKSESWSFFISFVADAIEPLLAKSGIIGFCFSYNAVVTPDIDAVVVSIDKEVKIHDAEGRHVGASLAGELEKRGYSGVRTFIVNDTAAVLLGGYSGVDPGRYSGFIGQVSGTGTNTCCILPTGKIKKLELSDDFPMIVNMEAGMFDCLDFSEFDDLLDDSTDSRGSKRFEKMTAGVYLGLLSRLVFRRAADEEYLTEKEFVKIENLGNYDTAVVDAWASGKNLEFITDDIEHRTFIQEVSKALILRSVKLMFCNIAAIIRLTDSGNDRSRPVCVFAEGSLVQKSRTYQEYYSHLISECLVSMFGKYAVLAISNESTFSGSAAAALLNC